MKSNDFDSLCYFNVLFDRCLNAIIEGEKTNVSIKRWLFSIKASKNIAEDIISTLTKIRIDLQVAIDDPKSYQNESYSYLTKIKLNRYYKFICDTHDDVTSFIDSEYPKKIRYKKPIDPKKSTSHLKYKEKDDMFGLTSISPCDIIGAEMLTIFNTKTNTLTLFHGNSEGLSVKGSTLLNFTELSQTKKLRKPKEVLPHFINIGFALVRGRFDSIKTKPSKPNGRINAHSVILWVKKKIK